jgi:Trehalose receptor
MMESSKALDISKKPVKPSHRNARQNLSFHQAVGPALAYGQLFGMLPVDGVLVKDESQIEFRWSSAKTIYSMIFLFCGTVESCMGARRVLRLGFKINFAEDVLLFISAMIRSFIMFGLARNWKKIIFFWRKCEEVFLHPPYTVRGWPLARKLRVACAVTSILTLGKNPNFNRKMIPKIIRSCFHS